MAQIGMKFRGVRIDMITPAFLLTATEQVPPKLALDFTTGLLDSRITFIRTTGAFNPATYVNSSGYVTAATNNQARFDYDPVALTCKGLLIEESRINKFTYSDDFSKANWVKIRSSIFANVATSPDGTSNADKLIEDATASATHQTQQIVAVTSGTSYTNTIYIKAGERTWASLRFSPTNGAFVDSSAWFNLSDGTLGTVDSGITASISNAGNGWYRCSATRTAEATVNGTFGIHIASANGTNSYTGNGTSGLYIWGAQLEAGASPTSYIPTTTTALTRNADVAVMTGANFSDWWQANKGGVLVRARPGTVSGIRPWVQFDDGTANEIIALRGNTTNLELYIVDGGSPQAQIDAGTIAANTDYSLTGWWQTNDCKARKDSGAVVTDDTATIPTVTQARLGSDGTNYLNGHLASVNYYDSFFGQSIYTRRKNKVIFNLM